jgi:hypothetical protein
VSLYHLFADFKTAYDTVDREQLYLAMDELKIPSKLFSLVKLTVEDTESHVRMQSDISCGSIQEWL